MNPESLRWLAAGSAGIGCLASMLLLRRLVDSAGSGHSGRSDQPWLFRAAMIPASMIAPRIQALLPASWESRARRLLSAEPWGASVPPAQWYAMRVVHAAAGAGLVAFVCSLAGWSGAAGATAGACCGYVFGANWLGRRRKRMMRGICRELPRFLDLLTVSVEAGATLTSGIRLIVTSAPPGILRFYFERVLREIRGGRSRVQAFESVARDFGFPELEALATALAHAESAGMSLGGVLRAQAGQWTAARFAQAEKLAMQAPVKLLGPLILCIFPCTFVVLSVPILVRLLEAFQ